MLRKVRARLARRSFDYQWAALPQGRGLLSDQGFASQVDRILSEEELCIGRDWFAGRRVLDAGCGNGRWIEGFLRLGCEVVAMDASANGLRHVHDRFGDRIRVVQGDVLQADRVLAGETFDLVFCWGVLHHTGDPAGGVGALSRLVASEGLLYLYLYGRDSFDRRQRVMLGAQRAVANALSLRARHALIRRRYGEQRAHEVFDLISTPLNDSLSHEDVEAMLRAAGLPRVERTIRHTELFLRADRGRTSADPYFLPLPEPPYWFQQLPG